MSNLPENMPCRIEPGINVITETGILLDQTVFSFYMDFWFVKLLTSEIVPPSKKYELQDIDNKDIDFKHIETYLRLCSVLPKWLKKVVRQH